MLSDFMSLKYLLNITKGCCGKILKDYDFQLMYHLGKANIVVNVLSRNINHVFVLTVKELK